MKYTGELKDDLNEVSISNNSNILDAFVK